MVGVVCSPDCIEVEALHEYDVSNHGGFMHSLAAQGVVLVPVDTCASRRNCRLALNHYRSRYGKEVALLDDNKHAHGLDNRIAIF